MSWRSPLPRRRHPYRSLVLTALAAASAPLLFGNVARAQSTSPFQPWPSDPWRAQRLNTPALNTPAVNTPDQAPVGGAASAVDNDTGFDFSEANAKTKKKPKTRPGDPHPLPPPAAAGPGAPQQASGAAIARQIKQRELYANAYRPPDAPPRRPPPPARDPYEPLGIRVGTFLLKPSIEITRGVDSNPGSISSGKGSAFTTVEGVLQARSQWDRHEAGLDLRGNYADYDSLPSSNRPLLDAKAYARIDASRDTAVNLEGRYFLSTDYPGSPNLPADIAKLPIFTTVGGTAGVTQRFNRLELSAKATVDRTVYQDSLLTDGTVSSNQDRAYDQYGGAVRAGYELMPGVKPFVEVAGDTRRHDLQFDRNGFDRDSNALTPRVGTSFQISQKLTGDMSVGYTMRRYDDANLQDLRGLLFDASLKWQATGLTTATLTAASRADEIVVAGASGALRRDVGLQVDHAFRRWLIGTLRFGYGFDRYVGLDRADNRWSLGTMITYKLSREMALKAEYRYEWLRSNVFGVDYNASVFLLGLKLQR